MRPQDLAYKLKAKGHHQAGDAITTLLMQVDELRTERDNLLKQVDFWKARCARVEPTTRSIPHYGRVR